MGARLEREVCPFMPCFFARIGMSMTSDVQKRNGLNTAGGTPEGPFRFCWYKEERRTRHFSVMIFLRSAMEAFISWEVSSILVTLSHELMIVE